MCTFRFLCSVRLAPGLLTSINRGPLKMKSSVTLNGVKNERKLLCLIALFFIFSCQVFAGEKEIVRNVDDFTGVGTLTFKDRLKLERTKGLFSFWAAWLTPEAVIGPDKKIKWIRLRLEFNSAYASSERREPLYVASSTNGTLKLKLDDNELIELNAINQQPDVGDETAPSGDLDFIDRSIYIVSMDQLKSMAMAKTIKVRVTVYNDYYINIPAQNYEISSEWFENMRRFY
jgi:hypothetical protein